VRSGLRGKEQGLFEIAHLLVAEMLAPYEILRANQSDAFFMACLAGQGQDGLDGRWRTISAGHLPRVSWPKGETVSAENVHLRGVRLRSKELLSVVACGRVP